MQVSEARKARTPRRRPLTTKRAALLECGDDHKFRKLIYDILALGASFELARSLFSSRIGVTGPQYTMLMAIADSPELGIRPSVLANALHLSKPFITVECAKLIRAGLVRKRSDLNDGRGALLTITENGLKELRRLLPIVQRVNDICFRSFSRAQFQKLCAMVDMLVGDSEAAVLGLDELVPTNRAQQ